MILGSWSMPSYLGIRHPYAYLIAMSLVDGFYPVLSNWMLNAFGKKQSFGLYVSKPNESFTL